jgi:hypothetical protein
MRVDNADKIKLSVTVVTTITKPLLSVSEMTWNGGWNVTGVSVVVSAMSNSVGLSSAAILRG